MRFSLFYEIQIPGPWDADSERNAYREAMDQIVLADQTGWHGVWAVEHHLLPGWSHCPAPEVFFGAVSQRTENLRIGHGVALLPKNFNHPIRVAERAAVLDILSGGRVEVGTGRAVTLQELNGFEINPDETKAMWEEGVQILPRAWTGETFEFKGKYFDIPPSTLVPKPLQKPHPPLWLAGTNPETFAVAGQHGLGMLGFVVGTPADIEPRINAYRTALKDAEPVGAFVNDKVLIQFQAHCAETREEALADVQKAAEVYAQLAIDLFLPWAQQPQEKVAESYKYLTAQRDRGQERSGGTRGTIEERMEAQMVAIGSPDDLIDLFKQYESMGVTEVSLLSQWGGLEHDKIMKSIQLISDHVIPAFAKTGVA